MSFIGFYLLGAYSLRGEETSANRIQGELFPGLKGKAYEAPGALP